MKKRSVICEPGDVVVVPFPFTDSAQSKRRPALVVSRKFFNRNGHSVLCMITSAKHQPWPGDHRIADLRAAGLRSPCTVRLKVFTLDNRLILGRIGRLSAADGKSVASALHAALL